MCGLETWGFLFFVIISSARNPFPAEAPGHPFPAWFRLTSALHRRVPNRRRLHGAISRADGGRTRPAVSKPSGRAASKKNHSSLRF